MNVIRRQRSACERAAARAAASVRWIVYVQLSGSPREQSSHDCPHEAQAVARELRRDCGLAAWVRRAG
jgi:hypothetical protein